MGYNAIEIDGEVKLDLSQDTVTEETLPEGVTAHDANGDPIEGKMKFVKSINGKDGDVTLGAEDVGARPDTWTPSAEDVGARSNTWMPSASDVGARPNTWMPSYSDVNADKAGTAQSLVSGHNTNTDAHNDIRLLIQGISDRLNAIANSDDTTLDDFKEVVAYIKSNKALIDSITTNKINYTDIINDLVTNVTSKPLSAAQGVALKALIDAITVPTKVSELENDKGYLTSYTESDPTVPAWAKAASKPSYTAAEVGALPSTTKIPTVPTKLSEFENDEEFISADGAPVKSVNNKTGDVKLSAEDVGARPNTWMPSYSDVNADKAGTAQSLVSGHNTNTDAHNDIRLELKTLADRINAVLDSDDTTLDELSEIVSYIKANKTLIDSITTSKVNVADIIDNLTTNVTNKPLSAAQGVALKALIDALQSGKLDASELSTAINTALAQAKASGEFDGNDGYTPVKGTDYWTSADKNAIVNEVDTLLTAEVETEVEQQLDGAKADIVTELIAQIGGLPVFGTVDENNVITTTTRLFNGTYVLRYKDENNTYSELAEFTITGGAEDVITYNVTNNLVACKTSNEAETANSNTRYQATITPDADAEPITSYKYVGITAIRVKMGGVDISSTAVSGNNINIDKVTGDIVISCIGYKTGVRLSLSTGNESTSNASDTETTGFIPVKSKEFVMRIKNVAYDGDTVRGVVGYDANFAPVGTGSNVNTLFGAYGFDDGNGVRRTQRMNNHSGYNSDAIRYVRLSSTDINEASIITIDEPIV